MVSSPFQKRRRMRQDGSVKSTIDESEEKTMKAIMTIGLDLAKHKFHVVGL